MCPELHRGLSIIFDNKTYIRLLVVALLPIAFSVQPSYAQSGIGVGLMASTPHAGGISVRYKAIQVIVGGNIGGGIKSDGRNQTDVTLTQIGVRYNHSVRDLNRLKFNVFSQVDWHKSPVPLQGSALPPQYLYTIGGSADIQIGRKRSSQGIFLNRGSWIIY